MGGKRKRKTKESVNGFEPLQKRSKSDAAKGKPSTLLDPEKLLQNHTPFVDKPVGEDRQREAFLYELLSSESDTDRVRAANAIVQSLLGGDGVLESLLDHHLDWRLFRGLSSGRNGSRLGLSLVISEIVHQLYGEEDLAATRYRGLTFEWLLKTFLEKTTPVGSMPGQGERDHYIGQLFGLQGFVQSKILFRGTSEKWNTVLDLLLKLANKKVWLRPQCGWAIVQALPQMKLQDVEKTLQKIADASLAKTPEGLGIWVAALDQFPTLTAPKPWRDPLATKHLQELPSVLKESGRDSSDADGGAEKRQKQNNWTAQLHFVWDVLFAHYLKLPRREKDDHEEQFDLFWNRVVDQSFFSKSASDNQKFTGFIIFQKALEIGCTHSFILKSIFSKNLMGCLINQASKEDRYLHRAAVKTLRAIENCVEHHPAILVDVLKELLASHGVYNFDERANTKTIEKILQFANSSDGTLAIDALRTTVLSDLAGDNAENRMKVYGEYISKIAGLPSMPKHTGGEPANIRALRELTRLAYVNSDNDLSVLTEKTRKMLRTRLTSSFAKLIKRLEDSSQLCDIILSINPDGFQMDAEIQTELLEALQRLKKLTKLRKKKSSAVSLERSQQGLALLYAVAILQLYNEESDALEILEDLKECFEKLQSKKSGDDGESSEFLIEILLSLVARPSSLMRQVSQQVFAAFSHIISTNGLALLTEPLAAGESARGQQALFNNEDEIMEGVNQEGNGEDDDDHSGGSELDSDVEIVDLEESEGGDRAAGDAGEEETGSDEEEQSEDDDEEQLKDLEALDDALAKVLQSHRLDKDAEAESSSSDKDMSDSEMMELDDKIASAFKHRMMSAGKNRNKDNKGAKETVVNFKNRVLDLLDIYVREQARNPQAFHILVPLLRLMRTTKAKPLAGRAHEVIASLARTLRKARANKEPVGARDTQDQLAVLRQIHCEALLDGGHGFARAASTASLAVASSLYAMDAENGEAVDRLYHETQLAWHAGKLHVQPSFFIDWLNWCQGHLS